MELALNLGKDELKEIIKEAVREVIEESKWDLFEKNLVYVSDKEMKDIESLYGEPREEDVYYSEELEI
jgi:hypothetical protein